MKFLFFIFFALFILFSIQFFIKIRLRELETKYGGKVRWHPVGPDFTSDEIELSLYFGRSGSSKTVNVKQQPKKHVWLELKPLNSLYLNQKSNHNSFDELYSCIVHVPKDFEILTQEIKAFIAETSMGYLSLHINQYEFFLRTTSIRIRDIENCLQLLIMVKNRIKEYESNT